MEFYQVNAPQAPIATSRFPKKWIFVAIGAVVLVAGVFLLVKVLHKSPVQVQRSEVRQELEANCKDTDCEIVLATNRAETSNDPAICQLIGAGDGITSCVKQYAYDQKDASACNALQGDAKKTCASSALYLLASSKGDIGYCTQIPDDNMKSICANELMAKYVQNNTCAQAGAFKDQCQASVDARMAIAKQIGPQLCDPFLAADPELGEDSPNYVTCLEVLDTVDLDGDGLMIRQEIAIGTDNQKKDTDGDGFDDGTEVRSGHDPLKP